MSVVNNTMYRTPPRQRFRGGQRERACSEALKAGHGPGRRTYPRSYCSRTGGRYEGR